MEDCGRKLLNEDGTPDFGRDRRFCSKECLRKDKAARMRAQRAAERKKRLKTLAAGVPCSATQAIAGELPTRRREWYHARGARAGVVSAEAFQHFEKHARAIVGRPKKVR